MKGVLLTGGRGTRLGEVTKYMNKHLINVGSKPMVEYPLKTLFDAGCDRVEVVYNDSRMYYLMNLYPHEKLHFVYQPEPLGTAEAINRTRDYVGDDNFMVLLGDNLFLKPLIPEAPPQVWACEIPNRGLTVLGAYYFDKKFFEYFPRITKSQRGEFETVDVISHYDRVKISSVRVEDWVDMGSPEGLAAAEKMVNPLGITRCPCENEENPY